MSRSNFELLWARYQVVRVRISVFRTRGFRVRQWCARVGRLALSVDRGIQGPKQPKTRRAGNILGVRALQIPSASVGGASRGDVVVAGL